MNKKVTLCGLCAVGLLIMMAVGCRNYYRAVRAKPQSSAIDSLHKLNRFFVLRSGQSAYHMKNIVISPDQKTLSCQLDALSAAHSLHLQRGRNGSLRYSKSSGDDLFVLNEVHFFTSEDALALTGATYKLVLDSIRKIEVLERDEKRTTDSYILGAIGYTVGAAALALVVAVALKSSCPFVSAYNGAEYTLQGEIYGGAIYPQMARYDFLPLHMQAKPDGSYSLKITNELKERQYTDLAELWMVNYKNGEPVIDEKGNLYIVNKAQAPVSALIKGKNIRRHLLQAGDHSVLYMDDTTSEAARNEVLLTFANEGGKPNGRLVLNLKNSYWLDMLYGEVAKGFGSYYPTYVVQQRAKPLAELLRWTREQQIPLEVSLRTAEGWKVVSEITTIGPLAWRRIVVPLEGLDKKQPVEIRLSSGFMFWEIDYAGIDFSSDPSPVIQKMLLVKARDERGRDVLPLLRTDDGKYLEQPQIGNVATLTFRPPALAKAGERQAFFLKTKGYYEHVRNFDTPPDPLFLQQFTQPGAFPRYGMKLHKKVREESSRWLAGAR